VASSLTKAPGRTEPGSPKQDDWTVYYFNPFQLVLEFLCYQVNLKERNFFICREAAAMQIAKWFTKQSKPSRLIPFFTLLIVTSVLLLEWLPHDSNPSKPFCLSLHIDKNGLPALFGINLGTGWFRSFVFRTLRIAGMHLKVVSSTSLTYGMDTNLIQTLTAVSAAGLSPPAPPPGPSPFE